MLKTKEDKRDNLPKSTDLKDIQSISKLLEHYQIQTYDDIHYRQTLLIKALGFEPHNFFLIERVIKTLISFQQEQGVELLPSSPEDYLRAKIFEKDSFLSNYVNPKYFGQEIARKNLFIMVEAYLEKYQIMNLDQLNKENFKLATALGLPQGDRRSAVKIAKALLELCHKEGTFLLPPTLPTNYSPISNRTRRLSSIYFDPNVVGKFAETNRELALVKYLIANRIHFISDLNKKHSALGFFLGLRVEDRRNSAKLAVALKKKYKNIAESLRTE